MNETIGIEINMCFSLWICAWFSNTLNTCVNNAHIK